MTPGGDPDFVDALVERAALKPRRILFPEGSDPRVVAAAASLVRDQAARPVLLGDPTDVQAALRAEGGGDGIEVLDVADGALIDRTAAHLAARRAGKSDPPDRIAQWAADPLHQAAGLVARGEADGVVAGCVRTTADVVRAALVGIGLADDISTLSSAFYMALPATSPLGPGVLTFTDAGVVPVPDVDALVDIAASAARARRRIVGDEPRVAFLSYSTKGSADGPAVTPVREAAERFRVRMPEVPSDGELQGDAALSRRVSDRKSPGSPVAGNANVLVFPDLDAANIAYKLVQYLAGAIALGPVLQGLRAPMNDLSRGASAEDVRLVACITALMAS